MNTIAIFAPVGSRPGFSSTNVLIRFFEPVGGKVATLNLNGFRFFSRAKTLAFPDKGRILLNRREGFLRFATRYEPKLSYTDNLKLCKVGQVDQSPSKGVRGLICFSRPSATVS